MIRRAIWRKGCAIAGFLGVALIAVVAVYLALPPIAVTFANESNATVSDVTLKYTGGIANLGTLGPGASATRRIRATGESDLVVTFVDVRGNKREEKVECYFEEHMYRGYIVIRLTESGKLVIDNHISISWF